MYNSRSVLYPEGYAYHGIFMIFYGILTFVFLTDEWVSRVDLGTVRPNVVQPVMPLKLVVKYIWARMIVPLGSRVRNHPRDKCLASLLSSDVASSVVVLVRGTITADELGARDVRVRDVKNIR